MEVRPGYIQTEVGVIPMDWDVKPFGDLFDFSGGFSASRAQLSEKGHCYLHYGDIHGAIKTCVDTLADFQDIPKLDIPLKKVSSKSLLKDGDVVFVDASEDDEGTSRHVVVVNEGNLPFISGLHTIVAKSKTDELTHEYRRYCFQTAAIRRQFLFYAVGTKVSGISKSNIPKLLLPFPTIPEQRAIAAALSDVDALLGGLDRLIAKKRDLKEAAMQQLLTGQTRLPGFGATRAFVSDELGTRPQDWDVIPLNELVDPARRIRYGIVQPGEYDRNGRYMIRGQDYSEAKGWADPSDVFRVSDVVEQRYRNARVQEGDLIMTIVGYCGHVEIVPGWLDGANLTQTTARIAIQPHKASQFFCKYMLQSTVGRSQVASFLKGAAQPGLNCGDVEKFRLPLPTMREQTAIADVLSNIDAELAALEARRDKTRDLKQAMMQELLTGKTRLVTPKAANV